MQLVPSAAPLMYRDDQDDARPHSAEGPSHSQDGWGLRHVQASVALSCGGAMSSDKHECPRRAEIGNTGRFPGPDRWTTGHGLIKQAAERSCSYCGSLHPDRFMELVRAGWIVGPTDKSYKAYLAKPYTVAEKTAQRQKWLATDAIARAIRDLGERDGHTPAEIEAAVDREWIDRVEPFLGSGSTEAKFYFQHLAEDQRNEFIDLLNAKQVKFSYPGYFYVLPFFCRRGDPTDVQA